MADEYTKDFWIYPAWESEKSVLDQPMFFNMPESNNLILDYENVRGEAISHFDQDPIDMKTVDQGTSMMESAKIFDVRHNWKFPVKAQLLNDEVLMPDSRINFISKYEYRGEVYHHFRKNYFNDFDHLYKMDFWTYPARESENGVVNLPMLFMPESKKLILNYESRREAFSHFRSKYFGNYPEYDQEIMRLRQELTSLDQGSKGFRTNHQSKFKYDAFGTRALGWLERNTYGMVQFGENPYLAIKNKNGQFGAVGPKKKDGISAPNQEMTQVLETKTPENFEDNGRPSSSFQTLERIDVPSWYQYGGDFDVHFQNNDSRIINPMCHQLKRRSVLTR